MQNARKYASYNQKRVQFFFSCFLLVWAFCSFFSVMCRMSFEMSSVACKARKMNETARLKELVGNFINGILTALILTYMVNFMTISVTDEGFVSQVTWTVCYIAGASLPYTDKTKNPLLSTGCTLQVPWAVQITVCYVYPKNLQEVFSENPLSPVPQTILP